MTKNGFEGVSYVGMRITVTALALVLAACEAREPPPPRAPVRPSASAEPASSAASAAPSGAAPTGSAMHAETPSAPPYDLAADREARIALAKKELGENTPVTIAEDVFVIVGLPGAAPLVKQALAAYFHDRFAKRPAEAITVYLFASAEPYDRYCKTHLGSPCISIYGFYRPDLRRIVMNAGPGLGTLTHELVHPIVETDFPQAPTWINEGIASLYEGFSMPKPGEIRGVKNWRHPRLVSAMGSAKERELAHLDRLFGMPDQVFRGRDESLHYALARYVCQWLDERGWLWPFYQKWRDNYATDKTGEKSFRSVTGLSPEEAHEKWAKWVRVL